MNTAIALGLGLIGCVVSAASQVVMKRSALRYARAPRSYPLFLSPLSIVAYGMYFLVTLLSLAAFRYLPLKAAMFLSPVTYLLVGILSVWALGERPNRKKGFAFVLLLAGVLIFNIPA